VFGTIFVTPPLGYRPDKKQLDLSNRTRRNNLPGEPFSLPWRLERKREIVVAFGEAYQPSQQVLRRTRVSPGFLRPLWLKPHIFH